jgi:hypothetical protein
MEMQAVTDIVERLRCLAAHFERVAKTAKEQSHASTIANEMRDAADEIERLTAAQTWQPIAMAPKDGTRIIISNFKYAEIVIWDDGAWMDCEGNDLSEWKWWIPMP